METNLRKLIWLLISQTEDTHNNGKRGLIIHLFKEQEQLKKLILHQEKKSNPQLKKLAWIMMDNLRRPHHLTIRLQVSLRSVMLNL